MDESGYASSLMSRFDCFAGVLANAHSSAINAMLVLDQTTLASGDEDGCIKVLNGFRKSTSPQNHQLIVYCHQSKYQVDGFVEELIF